MGSRRWVRESGNRETCNRETCNRGSERWTCNREFPKMGSGDLQSRVRQSRVPVPVLQSRRWGPAIASRCSTREDGAPCLRCSIYLTSREDGSRDCLLERSTEDKSTVDVQSEGGGG
ncbi:hypothetical protein ZOSMA_265G00330, partial [Zostera marina]